MVQPFIKRSKDKYFNKNSLTKQYDILNINPSTVTESDKLKRQGGSTWPAKC
jgi:hypothetical protein